MLTINPVFRFWLISSTIGLIFLSAESYAYEKKITILAFGDSITQGFKRTSDGTIYGITYNPNGIRTSDGYEPELEHDFATQTDYIAYVYNWGYGGERTYQGVNRIDSVLASREADFILIMEGANDLYSGVSASATNANLSIMIDKSRNHQIQPVVATVTPNTRIPEGYIIPTSYNPAIKSLTSQKSVPLADQYAALWPNWPGYTSGDGLHLNDAGEVKMAQIWFNSLLSFGLPSPQFSVAPILELLID